MRYLPLPFGPPIGWAPLKYLLDVGFTRDVWAHRIDIHAAIGRPMHLTADHDGRLVADIVAEWADIHGQPFELVLDGPAGGKFSQGDRRRARRDRRPRLHPHPLRSPARHRRPRQPAPALNGYPGAPGRREAQRTCSPRWNDAMCSCSGWPDARRARRNASVS